MFSKKVATAVAGLAILLTGCANNNSSKSNTNQPIKPFSAQVTPSNNGLKQQISGTSTKGSKVYYQVADNAKDSTTIKNKRFTITLPASLNTRKVTVSQKQNLSKPIKVTVKKPKVVISSAKFAKNFNNSKKMQAKMPTKTPKLDRPLDLMFSPTTTYHFLSDETHIYSMQLEITDITSSEVKSHVSAMASGLGIKKADLTDLVDQAKKNKGKSQTKDIQGYHLTTLVEGKKLTVNVTK
ncbi:hypothetical protein [Bombilactobacillus bombi]|uniref:hypothetical protein n=1 Tax=Bombilactobacillus bombi TaxID=1303590 RepID=UPI0015E5BC25|nr:hypothetical protein [Bombilactobacillus bombi]MBA1434224.1 hypothetical protein [Bombilactobacillus bombi]